MSGAVIFWTLCLTALLIELSLMSRNALKRERERERERLKRHQEQQEYINELYRRWVENQIRIKAQSRSYSKQISDEAREKMWKLYKLSVRGIGGEKQNATSMLNNMLQKNNVTLQTLLNEQKTFGGESL